MEKLLSKIDLSKIERDFSNDFDKYIGAVIFTGESDETTIRAVSSENHLIFVEGNGDTGYGHLRDRHNFFSFKNYWLQNEDKKFKLDNPSKFHPNMIPIIDFVKIADAIYTNENKNTAKNKRPDFFDLYTGTYCFEGSTEKYHLLTYKDSKVVHTLFPDKKRHNRKIRLEYGKGIVSTKLKVPPGYNDLLVPYLDSHDVVAYSILIRKFYSEKIERIFIQKHDKNGSPETLFLLGYRNFDDFETFERDLIEWYQRGDLSDFEKIINQIDKCDNDSYTITINDAKISFEKQY
ncbi:hypothetical protein [Fluviicola taffensis]|uniref:Uncharacterized protein n=1 Tax=Fluviicola taffensis (strain DSM 16823 / NCIMB 13979 / RW262) TaxID=755732 RepID=F2I9W5_FLUTR|nr:hypothetical protein [Fluviicola taffensis]AEA44123.1 hypothetical protein Fluta_2137 [Fluviicola taffensis DSM 16823]